MREQLKQGSEAIGQIRTRAKVVKNKVAPPFKTAEFDMIYGEGISREGSIIDVGLSKDILQRSGSWFSYEGDRIAQGRENVRQYLKENPQVADEIEAKIRALLAAEKNPNQPDADEQPEDAPRAP